MALPRNIERRQTRNGTNAPYHGWDASGRFWWINPRRANGRAYAWDAICRDELAPHLSADSLAAIGAKLAATSKPTAPRTRETCSFHAFGRCHSTEDGSCCIADVSA